MLPRVASVGKGQDVRFQALKDLTPVWNLRSRASLPGNARFTPAWVLHLVPDCVQLPFPGQRPVSYQPGEQAQVRRGVHAARAESPTHGSLSDRNVAGSV